MINESIDDYSPECLTVSLGPECNLQCIYCYAKNDLIEKSDKLDKSYFFDCVWAAADIVAENCIEKQKPFFLGFQGGGEPLIHFDDLRNIHRHLASKMETDGLKIYSFLTSNGCLGIERYKWVAQNIDRVCISLDGIGQVNDKHRRTLGGEGTFVKTTGTIKCLLEQGKIPAIRITVTALNVHNIAETVTYLIREFFIKDIQVEPVYQVNDSSGILPTYKDFVDNFLLAKEIAGKSGARLGYSGYRPQEEHGPYCNTEKRVLFLDPNGNASLCPFKDVEPISSPFVIGFYDSKQCKYRIDYKKICTSKSALCRIRTECENCEINESCVLGCPDVCMMTGAVKSMIRKSLRCKINLFLHERLYGN